MRRVWSERIMNLHVLTIGTLMEEFEYERNNSEYWRYGVDVFMDWCELQGQWEHMIARVLELENELG